MNATKPFSLLECLSPTAKALLDDDTHFYTCTYSWQHKLLGELRNSTVITGPDPDTAVKSFLSKHRNITHARVL